MLLCRALGELYRLQDFTTDCSAAPADELTPPTSHCLLPLLPISSMIIRGDHCCSVLSLLAMWTRLPAAPPDFHVYVMRHAGLGAVRFDIHSTSSANKGWLDALLNDQLPIEFYVKQDSNLRSLLPDLGRYSQPLELTLQSKVEPGVLGEVLAAYSGEQLTLRICVTPDAAAWFDDNTNQHPWRTLLEPELTDQHLQAMLPHVARLSSLDIRNCGALSCGALRGFVEGLGDGLTKLCLSDAKNVTDCILWALLRSCRKLQRLELSGAPGVSEAGLAPLLVVLQPSFSAEVRGTGVDWEQLQREVEGQGGCCRVEKLQDAAAADSSSSVNVYSSPK
jgi:hypothetical protein